MDLLDDRGRTVFAYIVGLYRHNFRPDVGSLTAAFASVGGGLF